MSDQFLQAFNITTDELRELRNGNFPARLKQDLQRRNYFLMLVGIGLVLTAMYILVAEPNIVAILALGVTGLLLMFGIYKNMQQVGQGQIEKITGTLEVKHSSNSYRRVITEDGQRFRVPRRQVEDIDPDTRYHVYILANSQTVLAIEPAD